MKYDRITLIFIPLILGVTMFYIQNKMTALLEKDVLLHGLEMLYQCFVVVVVVFPLLKQRRHFQLKRLKQMGSTRVP